MKPYLPLLALSGVLLVARGAQTQTTEELALLNYRVALDQISAGNAPGARLLLEADLGRGEIAPESASLLAYLEEKAGQIERARQTLQGVTAPTKLTAAYLNRLGGGETTLETARRGEAVAKNPALLETSDARIEKLETFLFGLVNAERRSRNLPLLRYDARMASVARAHSAEMRDKKYFAHESPTPDLREPLDRYIAGTGQRPRLVAENIYRAWGARSFLNEKDVRAAHQALMESPGHRSNILLEGATKMGIGITSNASGDLWITQLFARN